MNTPIRVGKVDVVAIVPDLHVVGVIVHHRTDQPELTPELQVKTLRMADHAFKYLCEQGVLDFSYGWAVSIGVQFHSPYEQSDNEQ